MWFPSIRTLLSRSRRHASARPPRQALRPTLELLEDRCTPSAFAVSAGGPLNDSGQGVGTDAAGDVYVAGNVGGTLSANDTDAFVAKYSPSGILQWSHVFSGRDSLGNSYGDSANAIAVDPLTGDAYVAGSFRARMDFGNNIVLTSTGPIDAFVIKLDSITGDVQWAHQFANTGNYGPPTYDRLGTLAPKGIALDHQGNLDVNGFFTGHIDMDPANPGLHFLDSTNLHPCTYVVQLDGDGNFAWEAQAANPVDGISAFAVAVDAQSNVYTIGTFGNFNYFNDSTANNSNQPNANSLTLNSPTGPALYVWKLNADGTNAWASKMGVPPNNTAIWGLGIAVDTQGNIYTTGAFNGTKVDFDPSVSHAGNINLLTSQGGNYDVFIDKMDSGGHFLWVRQVVSSGDDWGTGIALDTADNPYVTGYLTAGSTFGNILLTPASPSGNSFIAELSPDGDFLCAHTSVDLAPSGDKAAAIAVDGDGFVDITGAFAAQMQWPGLPVLTNGSGSSATDIFTVKTQLTCNTTLAVDFFHDPAPDRTAVPLYLNNAFTINMSGGSGNDLIGLLFGSGDSGGVMPGLLSGGSVNARLAGGAGDDVIGAMLWLDPDSVGHVDAKVQAARATTI